MAAKCPSCNRQGREIDFNEYKCPCGIVWTEPMTKRSLLAKRPGWFTRNRHNIDAALVALVVITVMVAAVFMVMETTILTM